MIWSIKYWFERIRLIRWRGYETNDTQIVAVIYSQSIISVNILTGPFYSITQLDWEKKV